MSVSLAPLLAQSLDEPNRSTSRAPTSSTSRSKIIVGRESWCGPGLDGQKTATGGRFDSRKLTAASSGLPLNSPAVVTNLNNERSVTVKVNDCGPVMPDRKIDLSEQAARRVGMLHQGVVPAKVKVINKPANPRYCIRLTRARVQSLLARAVRQLLQAVDFYRLGQVMIKAGRERTPLVTVLTITGESDHLHAFSDRERSDSTRNLITVDFRQADIHQREIEATFGGGLHSCRAFRNCDRQVAKHFEQHAERFGRVGIVLNNQDLETAADFFERSILAVLAPAPGSNGNLTVKVLPRPGPSLAASTLPPCIRPGA